MGLLDSLAQGLKSAGGTLNPAVYQDNAAEQSQARQQQAAQQNAMLGHVIQAIQNGSMAAPEGSPFQPSPQALAAKQALDVKTRQDALSQRILSNEKVQTLLADPTPVNLKKVATLFVANGLPIPAHIKDLEPKVQFAPAGSTPMIDGVAQTPIPEKAKTQPAGTVRKLQDGTNEVTQELQSDNTWKEIARGPKFARQVAPVINVGGASDAATPERERQVNYWADVLKNGGALPPGLARNRDGAALVKDVMKRVAAGDTAPADLIANQNENMGARAGQRTLGTRTANIEMAVQEAQNVMPIALAASEKVDRTKYPTLNSILLAAEKGTGDENTVQFGVATNSLINIYSRAIAPSGVPTVSDKDHAREILATAYSKGQYRAAVATMKQEMDAAQRSPGQVRNSMRPGATHQNQSDPLGIR